MTLADGEETLRAGDLCYLPPGHSATVQHDFEHVEFSPRGAYDAFLEVAQRNIATVKATITTASWRRWSSWVQTGGR